MLVGTECLRNGMIKRRNPQGKARIVMGFLTTSMSAANCIASAMYCGHIPRQEGQVHAEWKKGRP